MDTENSQSMKKARSENHAFSLCLSYCRVAVKGPLYGFPLRTVRATFTAVRCYSL